MVLYVTDEIQGVVVKTGEPVAGAKVVLSANSGWYGDWETQTVITDNSGEFMIPRWKIHWTASLVHQPVVRYDLSIELEDSSYQGWENTSMRYSGSRSQGRILLTCDLDITDLLKDERGRTTGVCIKE